MLRHIPKSKVHEKDVEPDSSSVRKAECQEARNFVSLSFLSVPWQSKDDSINFCLLEPL